MSARPAQPLFGRTQRVMPGNQQAEQALLGAILANNKALDRAGFLQPEHFIDPINGRIFAEARRQIEAGRNCDAITLKATFENTGILDEVGGTAYLAKLLGAMVGIINAGEYASVIRDGYLRRQAIEISTETTEMAFGADPDQDGEAVITEAIDRLLTLQTNGGVWEAVDIGDGIDAAMDAADTAYRGAGPRPLLTGLQPLDDIWGGMYPQALDYLGARSQHGKTALGLQIMRNVAEGFLADHRDLLARDPGSKAQPRRVLFSSLEMGRVDIGTRMLATETGIPSTDLRRGNIGSNGRAEAMIQARSHLRRLPMLIQDAPGQSLSDIETSATIAVRRKNVGLIVIDHLHRIKPSSVIERLPRGDQIAFITAALKDLARRLNVPILLLCQLVKDVERREDPRPMVADIKYAVEQDADNIILVWRPELHMPERTPPINAKVSEEKAAEIAAKYHAKRTFWRGKAEAIGAKQRFGEAGRSTTMGFVGHTTTFVPLDAGDDPFPDNHQAGLF